MYIICIKDLISISGAKFHSMILIVKFHMQFEKKTIAPNPSTYIYIICIKDMKSIRSVKLHLIISTVKFHTQFEEKTVVSNPSDILNLKRIKSNLPFV